MNTTTLAFRADPAPCDYNIQPVIDTGDDLSLSFRDVAQFEDYRIPFGLLLNRELSRSSDVVG